MTFNQLACWVMSLDSGFLEMRKDAITKAFVIYVSFEYGGKNWGCTETISQGEVFRAREDVDALISERFDRIKERFDEMVAESLKDGK